MDGIIHLGGMQDCFNAEELTFDALSGVSSLPGFSFGWQEIESYNTTMLRQPEKILPNQD